MQTPPPFPLSNEAVEVGHSLLSVCVYVCERAGGWVGVCVCSHYNSSPNEVRMLKFGTYIHTHKPWSWYVFEVKRSKVKVTFLVKTLAPVVTSQKYGHKFASPPSAV